MIWMLVAALASLIPGLLLLEFGYSQMKPAERLGVQQYTGTFTLIMIKVFQHFGYHRAQQKAAILSGWLLVTGAVLIVITGLAGLRL